MAESDESARSAPSPAELICLSLSPMHVVSTLATLFVDFLWACHRGNFD
jgi:hypothetical protein